MGDILGCTARFQGDDCVNINGKYHYVSGAQGRLVRIAVLNNRFEDCMWLLIHVISTSNLKIEGNQFP